MLHQAEIEIKDKEKALEIKDKEKALLKKDLAQLEKDLHRMTAEKPSA
jgi:5'-3' exonuclease